MQGSVWGSLKCTTSMDTLNRIILEQKHLTYKYRSDPNIEIGVMGMVDDNLCISMCGITSVQKNAIINSFIETQRLTLSKSKSVVIHVGRPSKCRYMCPTLKVHEQDMKTGINLPAEQGWVSKNLPRGPRGRFLLIHPSSAGMLIILVLGTLPFLINLVSSSNSKDTSHPNKYSIRPY